MGFSIFDVVHQAHHASWHGGLVDDRTAVSREVRTRAGRLIEEASDRAAIAPLPRRRGGRWFRRHQDLGCPAAGVRVRARHRTIGVALVASEALRPRSAVRGGACAKDIRGPGCG